MLKPNIQPVIKKALGKEWEALADVIKKHYDITPGNNISLTLRGGMSEVYHSNIAKLYLLPGRLFGALVPYRGKNIPTTVKNWTKKNNDKAMFWHRTLHFPNKAPTIFQSRMEHLSGNEIIEYVRYGMGIRMALFEVNHSLVFRSVGYVWKIGGLTLSIPNWLILGDAVITEKAISKRELHLDFEIIHPLFGKTFSYTGVFTIV
ncbi:MAG: DUF4166 domain-containing protein [Candidatus Thiodiazotropha sp.]|jgi:hypothetical protein